ncbi:uncharacterized protein G2W53_040588 [Senna tora]|uniref:Uncharacterized protein n=1 Tax=Senna tora TaxID=362788 RepID=A0A834SDN9_9FABA|nr:uncharacterized protein G2W53_040588 [Senna tora]
MGGIGISLAKSKLGFLLSRLPSNNQTVKQSHTVRYDAVLAQTKAHINTNQFESVERFLFLT